MVWNSVSPDGTKSVKANRSIVQANTTYIEDSMGDDPVGTDTVNTRDHFWNVSSNVDGRHRFIQSLGYTVGGSPADPLIGTGMDCVLYPKQAGDGTIQYFYQNVGGVAQVTPTLLKGTVALPAFPNPLVNVVTVPANVYGEIFMWAVSSPGLIAIQGYFISDAAKCYSNNILYTTGSPYISFDPTGGGGLNIRATTISAPPLTWNYRIRYWDV